MPNRKNDNARNFSSLFCTAERLLLIVLPMFALALFTGCTSMYRYRAITDDCLCEEYRHVDAARRIVTTFKASYDMRGGIITVIEIAFTNNSSDTLMLNGAHVKVASKNFSYQYNDKFLPLPDMAILPRSSDHVRLSGQERAEDDDWHKIAGEKLSVTIKGLQLGKEFLPPLQVVFVPENPKLGK